MVSFESLGTVSYSHSIVIMAVSLVIQRQRMAWPWNLGLGSFKVSETGAIRKLGRGFLFAFYSNCGRICSRLWDIQCQI